MQGRTQQDSRGSRCISQPRWFLSDAKRKMQPHMFHVAFHSLPFYSISTLLKSLLFFSFAIFLQEKLKERREELSQNVGQSTFKSKISSFVCICISAIQFQLHLLDQNNETEKRETELK